MTTLRSILIVAGHPRISHDETNQLHKEFVSERISSDEAYNTMAKELGVTFGEAKNVLPQFLFVTRLDKCICILFDEPGEQWGCYIVGKKTEDCTVVDSRLRNRIGLALSTTVVQLVTDYPKYERPKDVSQFLLATVGNILSALAAGIIPMLGQPAWIATTLILILLIPIYLLGDWSLRR